MGKDLKFYLSGEAPHDFKIELPTENGVATKSIPSEMLAIKVRFYDEKRGIYVETDKVSMVEIQEL